VTQVAIVGAGPAGASLAYLLARNGVEVTLIERRQDFAREFRGEILMPSGVDAFRQMGLLEQMRSVAHHQAEAINVYLNRKPILSLDLAADSSGGVGVMALSQPELLEMLVRESAAFSNFTFLRGAVVRELLRDDVATGQGRVRGLRVALDDSEQVIDADLVVGADGRNSAVRRQSDFATREISPPMDIVWCKLPLPEGWRGVRGFAGHGHLLVAYHTWGNELQLGWVILKGTFGELRARGIEQWVEEMANHVTDDFAAHLRANLASVQRPFLLDAASECVLGWSKPGVLLIGDAAHTMSPVGGQGLNIALRDAVVAANHLVPALASTGLDEALLRIEQERMPEVAQIQKMQAMPPKLILNRAWWGEPLRNMLGKLLTNAAVRQRAAGRVSPFLFGVTEVQLTV